MDNNQVNILAGLYMDKEDYSAALAAIHYAGEGNLEKGYAALPIDLQVGFVVN